MFYDIAALALLALGALILFGHARAEKKQMEENREKIFAAVMNAEDPEERSDPWTI